MNPTRRTALIAGVAMLITFIFSIPAQFIFYEPLLKHSDYLLRSGADTRITLGAFCEILVIVGNIATATVLFPFLKRQSESLAISYVAARIMECALITIGILSMLTALSLRQAGATGAEAGSLRLAGKQLVALHDWTFLLGPGFVVGIGNGLILGYLMYSSQLLPRRMAVLGLVGGPLILLSGTAVLFGLTDAGSVVQAVATIPEFFWELGVGIYLTFKGFRPEGLAALGAAPTTDAPPVPRPRPSADSQPAGV
jgi:Domain of unknown function (DUF4386)